MRRLVCIAGLILLALAAGRTARADQFDEFYRARAIVTGQEEVDRRRGFALCLKEVLIKVSGDARLAHDPRVAVMLRRAESFVDTFGYRDRMADKPINDEQGTRDRPYDLTVRFQRARIDEALKLLGRKPWLAARPRVALAVAVDNGAVTYVLASDSPRGADQRDALAAAAVQFGMPMALPDGAALAAAGLTVEALRRPEPPRIDVAALGGDVAVTGSLIWSDKALGWVAEWRLAWQGKSHRWRVGGVSFDDAFRSALGGAAQILSGHGTPD